MQSLPSGKSQIQYQSVYNKKHFKNSKRKNTTIYYYYAHARIISFRFRGPAPYCVPETLEILS